MSIAEQIEMIEAHLSFDEAASKAFELKVDHAYLSDGEVYSITVFKDGSGVRFMDDYIGEVFAIDTFEVPQ